MLVAFPATFSIGGSSRGTFASMDRLYPSFTERFGVVTRTFLSAIPHCISVTPTFGSHTICWSNATPRCGLFHRSFLRATPPLGEVTICRNCATGPLGS